MSTCLGRFTDGCCKPIDPHKLSVPSTSAIPTAPPPPITISASVGMGGKNVAADVTKIQDALNRIPAGQGNPVPPLTVDGACGDKTKNAIQLFQIKHFGWSGADGRVDPGGQTLAKINALVKPQTLFASNGEDVRIVDDKTRWYWQLKNIMVFHLPEAIRWIRLAKQELIDALPVADKLLNPPANRAALMKKINRHFAIDKMANRQMTLRMMIRVFEDMDVAAQTGESSFAVYPKFFGGDENCLLFTFPGAVAEKGRIDPTTGLEKRVYFVAAFLPVWISRLHAASGLIIHELAHWVGAQRNVGFILDPRDAYGAPDSAAIKVLTPNERIHSAECYANFAFDVATNLPGHYQDA